MDGYAVVAGAAGELPVVGESRAGRPAERPLEPGEAMRISTGAAVPEGADAVVPVERVEAGGGRRGRAPGAPPGAARPPPRAGGRPGPPAAAPRPGARPP